MQKNFGWKQNILPILISPTPSYCSKTIAAAVVSEWEQIKSNFVYCRW